MSVIQIVCIVLLLLILIGANAILVFFWINGRDLSVVPFPIALLAAVLDGLLVMVLISGAFGAFGSRT